MGDAGVLSPGKWLWFRSVLWSIPLSAAAFILFLAALALPGWLHLPDSFAYVSALGIPALAFWLYALAVRVAEKRNASEVALSHKVLPDLIYGILIGIGMLSSILGLLWLLGLYHVERHHLTRWYDSFVFDSYVSGMLEELLFRAILLRLFARGFGIGWGLILSSILFGVAHLGHATLLQAGEVAFNGGLMLGLLYIASGRLWMAVGMHIAWDFLEGAIFGVNTHSGMLLSRPVATRSLILTGGSFGPDGSLPATLVGFSFVAGTLWALSGRRPLLTGRRP